MVVSGDDSPVWSPLVGSAFAEACSYVSDEGHSNSLDSLTS